MADNNTYPLELKFSESGGKNRIYYSLECGEGSKVELLKPSDVNWVTITELTDSQYKYREGNKNYGAFLRRYYFWLLLYFGGDTVSLVRIHQSGII